MRKYVFGRASERIEERKRKRYEDREKEAER